MAKGINAYIGNPAQQQQVEEQLGSLLQKKEGGIFVISGPHMVGKNTLVDKLTANNISPGQRHTVVHDDDPEVYGFTSSDLKQEMDRKTRTLVIGEVPVNFRRTFKAIREFYAENTSEGPLTIILNVSSTSHPAWKNQQLKDELNVRISEDLPGANIFYLESEPSKIPDVIRTGYEKGQSTFDAIIMSLGLEPKDTEDIREYLVSNNREGYDLQMKALLRESVDSGSPEVK